MYCRSITANAPFSAISSRAAKTLSSVTSLLAATSVSLAGRAAAGAGDKVGSEPPPISASRDMPDAGAAASLSGGSRASSRASSDRLTVFVGSARGQVLNQLSMHS